MKITTKTPLYLIKQMVFRDFGVVLENSDADQIRSNNILWTREKLTISAGYISRITSDGVRLTSGATYSTEEWNREYLEAAKRDARRPEEKYIVESVEWDIKHDDEFADWVNNR